MANGGGSLVVLFHCGLRFGDRPILKNPDFRATFHDTKRVPRKAIKQSWEPMAQAGKEFAMEAAKRNGATLRFMSSNFQADLDIVQAAMLRDPRAVNYAHPARRQDLGHATEASIGEAQMAKEYEAQAQAAKKEAEAGKVWVGSVAPGLAGALERRAETSLAFLILIVLRQRHRSLARW